MKHTVRICDCSTPYFKASFPVLRISHIDIRSYARIIYAFQQNQLDRNEVNIYAAKATSFRKFTIHVKVLLTLTQWLKVRW